MSDSEHKAGVNDGTFETNIATLSQPILELCTFGLRSLENENFPCRDFLIHLHREATRLEELVDYYGAQRNRMWFPFRESIAAAKLFSDVTYAVKHIQGALEYYNLHDIESDFIEATDQVIEQLTAALTSTAHNILDQASRCGLDTTNIEPTFKPCGEDVVEFRLPSDRTVRHVAKVGEVVVYLATRFLNLSEDRDVRTVLREPADNDYASYVPEPISEEQVRIVESRFHNLQSLYDTYIFESDIEQQNPDLRYLRSHISVIFHLLETATALSHYYIRHMSSLRRDVMSEMRYPMSQEALLTLLFEYPIHYSRLYLESAVALCQQMIRSYSEETQIEVPIPSYRGFHVRPSTLVASIVAHYGSDVTMTLNGHEYNAATPLELFRANEDINAMKRRRIADLLCDDPALNQKLPRNPQKRSRELQLLFVRLMKENKVVMYDTNLDVDEVDCQNDETFAEYAAHLIKHFMSVGKIDIRSELTVQFSGDNRALHDLEILASNGYGEDQMGNNIMLPEELSYLKR
jgi:hypothetical protein